VVISSSFLPSIVYHRAGYGIDMKSIAHRPLGRTGISVSEIGLGGWQLANPLWESRGDDEARKVVEQALDDGCNFFDTAPGYSDGRSEELLGQTLKPVRSRVTICTKFGHGPDGTNFDAAAIRPSLETSLRRLQTEYVDILLLHNPPAELLDGGRAPQYEELERLKTEGKLRVYGVSLDHGHELDTVVKTTRCGAVEVLFNVFHQEPLAAFRQAATAGIGLIVKVPLDSGWLSGKYRQDSRFVGVRERWSSEIIARRAALVEQFAALVPPGTSLAHAALQYALAQPEVSTVIPGAKTAQQARDNLAAAGVVLSGDVVRAIHAFWERELKYNPLPW
jgi:aryl-alcohol dehydrogenase-like predicted oxidoreductase